MTADVERALLVWPIVASLVATFGTAAFVFLVAREGFFDLPAIAAPLLNWWRFFATVIFLLSPLLLLSVTADMASVSWTSAVDLVPQVLKGTHAGRVFEWFLPMALLLFLSVHLALQQSSRTVMMLLFSAALLLLLALLSHAIDKGNVAVVVYFLHEIAVGLWTGSLLTLWTVARCENSRDEWIEHAAGCVSKVAFWSVIVLVITGTYTAYNCIGLDIYRLVFSAYGRTLIVKVTIFAAVLVIGAYNRYYLVPKVSECGARNSLLRNVQIEWLILIFVVMGVASLLANTPPAHNMAGHPMSEGSCTM